MEIISELKVTISDKDKVLMKIRETLKPIEANVIGILWNNPSMYHDYPDLNNDMFKSPIWKFYYSIGKKIVGKNVQKIDEVAVEVYLQDKEKSTTAYNSFGRYETIENLQFFATTENMDSYVNELKKWSALYKLIEDITIQESDLTEFSDLDANEIYDYFNVKLNNVFLDTDDGVETHHLQDGLDELIAEADAGMNVGMPIPSKILNNEIGGIIDGQLIIVGGLSGTGKSSISIQLKLSSCLRENEPLVFMANEQDSKFIKKEILIWIVNNILAKNPSEYFNKKRWREGKFTDIEKQRLNQAKEYLEERMKDNKIVIAQFKSYSRKQAEKIIRKYSALGVKKFVLDTFKISSQRDDNESFWLSMQEDMRKLDDLIKPSNLNVTLWVTLQLQKGSVLKRYITGDSIGMAKNVIDVASVALLMRRVRNDEYKDGRFELNVIDPIGESKRSGKTVSLDPTKKYVVIFIEKNRNGEAQTYQIIAEQDLGHLVYKEVGVTDIPFDT